MARPRGSRTVPDTIVYHRVCYRFDTAVPAENQALNILKNPSTKPSGFEAARGAIIYYALKDVLSPIVFQKLMALASDFYVADEAGREDHPFIEFAHSIGQKVSPIVMPVTGVMPQPTPDVNERIEDSKPVVRKKTSKKTPTELPASEAPAPIAEIEEKEAPKGPQMDDGYDDMDTNDLSAIYKMSMQFMEQ